MNIIQKQITIGDRVVTVHEMTVSEIRSWVASLDDSQINLVDHGLIDTVSLPDIQRMTDLTPEETDGMTPSQIDTVVDACKGVNGHFFKLAGRIIDVAQSAMADRAIQK
ncbi:MAG: hypothetical protein HQM00_05730 [Magnetococcales bacterium]|nr:hypothetical protein [Magnetococcales bacterium]